MNLSRRHLLKLSAASTLALATRQLFAQTQGSTAHLPSPDFTFRDGETRFVAGLRPYRKGSYRLVAESLNERFLVHNYGHGGAGITLSWGCAHEVLDQVRAYPSDHKKNIAVLGAGALGLTSAYLLMEAGYKVTIYAKGFLEETTSHVAGGQWAPSTIAYQSEGEGLEEFHRILRRAFRTHEAKIGKGFGVVRRNNFTDQRSRTFERIPKDIIPEPTAYENLPLEHHRAGFSYATLLVEPPIFLRRLEVDLRLGGVWLRRRTFSSIEDVLSLEEQIIVNCLGLGAGAVFSDEDVVPIKGQLVLLKPQPDLEYLYSGTGYIFPRRDAVVIGGSFEEVFDHPNPDPEKCLAILAVAKAGFEPHRRTKRRLPDWILQDKHL